jgi:FkbM family methyltransferase
MKVVKKRLNIMKELLNAAACASLNVKGVSFASGLTSLFQLYGLRKRILQRKMYVERTFEIGSRKVTIKDRSIYWPTDAPVNRLLDMYFEVFHENNHRFDTCGTELRKDDVVVDAGCCEGYFSMLAIENGASKVYSFEPGKSIGACLERTFRREIEIGRLEIVPMLLGEKCGKFGFIENPEDPTIGRLLPLAVDDEEGYSNKVTMTTLDFFFASRPLKKLDYLKIDVEGAEPGVIEGAKDVIKLFAPRIAVAVYHEPHHAQQLQEMILGINNTYQFHLKGLVDFNGVVRPVMLHCYTPSSS